MFVDASARTRSIITIQRQGVRPTWVIRVSRDDPLGCSFSSRTSPSRCSRGQPSNDKPVSADFILNLSKNLHISLFLYTDSSFHMLGADGSVYVCGENAFDLFHFAPRYPGTDNTSRSTLHISQADCTHSTLAHQGMGASRIPSQVLGYL